METDKGQSQDILQSQVLHFLYQLFSKIFPP